MEQWWPYCDTCDNVTSDSIVNEMHTCSSHPNSNHSNSDRASHTITGAECNVQWLLADKIALIDFLIANEDKAADRLSLKQSVWNPAAEHLQQVRKKVVQRLLENARPSVLQFNLTKFRSMNSNPIANQR